MKIRIKWDDEEGEGQKTKKKVLNFKYYVLHMIYHKLKCMSALLTVKDLQCNAIQS